MVGSRALDVDPEPVTRDLLVTAISPDRGLAATAVAGDRRDTASKITVFALQGALWNLGETHNVDWHASTRYGTAIGQVQHGGVRVILRFMR